MIWMRGTPYCIVNSSPLYQCLGSIYSLVLWITLHSVVKCFWVCPLYLDVGRSTGQNPEQKIRIKFQVGINVLCCFPPFPRKMHKTDASQDPRRHWRSMAELLLNYRTCFFSQLHNPNNCLCFVIQWNGFILFLNLFPAGTPKVICDTGHAIPQAQGICLGQSSDLPSKWDAFETLKLLCVFHSIARGVWGEYYPMYPSNL